MPKKKKRLSEVVGMALVKAGKICIFVPFLPGLPMIVGGRAMLSPSKRKRVKILPPIIEKIARGSIIKVKALMVGV